MSTPEPQHGSGAAPAATVGPEAPVGPALIVRLLLAPMTKLLNPLVGKFAGRKHFWMAAQIHHVGRRSGRHYTTSVGAHMTRGIVLLPLTFGTQSDWVRNVYAAGTCWVRLNGVAYRAVQPVFLDPVAAAPLVHVAFRPIHRFGFKVLGIKQFMRLQVTGYDIGR